MYIKIDNMAVKHCWGRLCKGSVTLVKPGSAALQMSSVLNQFSINQIFVRISSTFTRRAGSRAGGRVQSVHFKDWLQMVSPPQDGAANDQDSPCCVAC